MSEPADRREAAGIGRHARLELRFAYWHGRTALVEAYAEPPFRVGRWFPEGEGLHMTMASSGPGIFGGDRLEQTILIEPGAAVRLTSQSSLQVHPSAEPVGAACRARYVVAAGGCLSCHWDPLIPFADARFDQQIRIEVAQGGQLYWSDGFMAGREARGERWRFHSITHELRLVRNGSLDYLERYRIEPGLRSPSEAWVASEACYVGTTLVSGPEAMPLAETLHAELASVPGLCAGADALDDSLLLVRLLASEGVPFHAAREHICRRTHGVRL